MGAKVLIVEDEAITALDLKYCLEDLGYDVVGVADTGRDAIDVANEELPNVVLMDIKLKGDMEGTEAAKVISKLDIPVIFVSANSDFSTFEKLNQEGSFAFVSKPFDIEKLKETIEDILDV
jgi:1,2-diacylglycerol 3-beta-glucosyltransferase